MSKAHPPELKKFMDKKLSIKLNAGRGVTGVLRGFDPFMNLVLDESVEECKDGQRNNIGMVYPLVIPALPLMFTGSLSIDTSVSTFRRNLRGHVDNSD